MTEAIDGAVPAKYVDALLAIQAMALRTLASPDVMVSSHEVAMQVLARMP